MGLSWSTRPDKTWPPFYKKSYVASNLPDPEKKKQEKKKEKEQMIYSTIFIVPGASDTTIAVGISIYMASY